MARPRTPTNVLKLRGVDKVHPARLAARAGEPEPVKPIGAAPVYLSESERACYDELVDKSHAGVLCHSDGVVIEVGAVLLARLRANTAQFKAHDFGRLHAVLGALGMTPADRSKVSAFKAKEKSADPLDEFEAAG